ncbi:MAG: type II restriction endonuclease [Methanobrevibacter olleyae]|uniref:Type II restriction endonuclease n=1 Tax=Methanobrevibacter olleyae TaxID=294671 RepID=A0A8T3VRW6_METOL|nr:type II restriction endonuclease [Methanosphaera stadtmanae]MBE6513477.1 type II restriction endonuclease [Methanobrevibacter olleyae]
MNSLLVTNHNFDFFVNWEKIYDNLKENLTEISILNSLNKVSSDEVESEFRKIITYYPEVVPILPSILAIRFEKKKEFTVDIFDGELKKYDFNDETYDVEDVVYFCKQTGLLDLFNKISDLYTYLLGTEVGLDTNGRKNRSGTSFESFIENLLEDLLKDYSEYSFTSQTFVEKINRKKQADFVISKNGKQFIIIECNFYNSIGSKPIEVANAYIDLQNQLSKENLIFLWITDGQGWTRMNSTLVEVLPSIDYLLNYNLLKKYLKTILELD